jgi:hypothetical protein
VSRLFVDKRETDDLGSEKPYRVEFTLTPAEGITPCLFVFSLNDDWQHVATADDIERYPESIALATDVGFYRTSRMTRSFQRKVDRANFSADLIGAVRNTMKTWSGDADIATVPVETLTLEES